MLTPKDPAGRTAWDYAAGIWNELDEIRQALTTDDPETTRLRWITAAGPAYAGGGLVSDAILRVPVGCHWTSLAVAFDTAGAGADVVTLYRNVAERAGFIGRYVAAAGVVSMVNLPDNLVLEENTLLIARTTILLAADGQFPVMNVATRQVQYGPPPQLTRETGEDQGREEDWNTGETHDRIAVYPATVLADEQH